MRTSSSKFYIVAFTATELLVVVGIIILLFSLIFPAAYNVKKSLGDRVS